MDIIVQVNGEKSEKNSDKKIGENRVNALILKLSELRRTDGIIKAAADKEYQENLFEEFEKGMRPFGI